MKDSSHMKILYLSDQDLDNESGVSQKICMQVRQWLASGHEVSVLSLESLSFFSVDKKRISPPKVNIKRAGWKIFIHLIYSSWTLKSVLKDCDFDIVYMRYRLYSPYMKRALKNRPQIVEINTDDVNEYRHSSFLLYMYNIIFRRFFLSKVDGFVCVSKELNAKFKVFNKPTLVIANGIKMDELTFQDKTHTTEASLVFIGSENQKWHGVKKIVRMAKELKEFSFHIIGQEGDNTENLFYYGYLPTDKANAIVQKHDIGVSTLSLYENKMKAISSSGVTNYIRL